jgi:hypothetical protein
MLLCPLESHKNRTGRALPSRMVETIMMKMPQEKLQADWVATQNIARFQELLRTETDKGRCKILERLLADEFVKFKEAPSL